MASETIELADRLVFTVTGRHLNDLQRTILRQVWQGQKYLDIANTASYTEGHIKDVAYQMWRLLSRVTGEKVTKSTLKSALKRSLHRMGTDVSSGVAQAAPDEEPLVIVPMAPADLGFVGRQGAIADLTALVAQGHRTLLIQGEGGLGKTTLAQHFLAQQPVDTTLELLMAKDPADITPVEWVVEEWLGDFAQPR